MATIEEVREHYDRTASLFELILDGDYRAYSAGRWRPGDTLELAQRRNLLAIVKELGITSKTSVLDIGCGWGALTKICMEDICVKDYVGLTPSPTQVHYIKKRYRGNLQILQLTWQEYLPAFKNFDAVVALESAEHIASYKSRRAGKSLNEYRHFFNTSANLSTDAAPLYLQSSVVCRLPRTRRELKDWNFILQKVFPGSALPDLEILKSASRGIYDICNIDWNSDDYILTLKAWRTRLHRNIDEFVRDYGRDQFDFYEEYLNACIRLFDRGVVGLLRLRFEKAST